MARRERGRERGRKRERGRDRGRGKSRRGGDFEYRERDPSNVDRRATMQGGQYENPWRGDVKVFKPHNGKNRIRILPPTWDDADHFGLDVWVHRGVGPENAQFACLKYVDDAGGCPVCEEVQRATAEGEDSEYVKGLKARRRVAVWLIDRSAVGEGPMLWLSPWTWDRDLAAASKDDDSGETLVVDHPKKGYDVRFTVEKSGDFPSYVAIGPVRKSSPISSDREEMDEWLDYVVENPIPDVLVHHDYDHVAASFDGKAAQKDDDEDDEPRRSRSSRYRRDDDEDDDDEPRSRRSRYDDEDDDDEDESEDDPWSRPDEDDDEDLDDDEDEDDDEPKTRRPTRGQRSSGRGSRGSKRRKRPR